MSVIIPRGDDGVRKIRYAFEFTNGYGSVHRYLVNDEGVPAGVGGQPTQVERKYFGRSTFDMWRARRWGRTTVRHLQKIDRANAIAYALDPGAEPPTNRELAKARRELLEISADTAPG